jgi:hypothetical protein
MPENVLVRYARTNGNGPCVILGIYLRETKLYTIYRILNQKSNAYVSKAVVHTIPCRNCMDHPQTKFPREVRDKR